MFSIVAFADTSGIVPASAPWWLAGTISAIEAIPVVGPIVAQVVMWFGIILAIVTALLACVRAIVSSLSTVAGFAGMDKASAWLDSFEHSSTMYWLKYISGFTKPASPPPPTP